MTLSQFTTISATVSPMQVLPSFFEVVASISGSMNFEAVPRIAMRKHSFTIESAIDSWHT